MWSVNSDLLTLITAGVNLALGLLVINKDHRKLLNKSFFLFTLLIAAWSISIFAFEQVNQNIWALRLQYSFGGLVLAGAYPWIFYLIDGVMGKRLLFLFTIIGLLIFFLPISDGLLIENIVTSVSNEGLTYTQGPLFSYFGFTLFLLMLGLIYKISVGVKTASSEVSKKQLRYVLSGVIIFASASALVNIILPLFNVNIVVALDAQSSLIWVALTAYAITRHGLFNIKVIATEIFVGLLLILILIRLTASKSTPDFLFESAVLVLTGGVGYFLVRSVKDEVIRREEIEKLAKEKTETLRELEQRNKNLATLQKISQLVLNENDLRPMVQTILDEIPKQLESCIGAQVSLARDGKLVGYSITTTEFSRKIFSLVGNDLEKYTNPIKKGFNLLHDSLIERQTKESDRLSDFISPPIPKAVALTIQKIIGTHHLISIPLYSNQEPLGVMLFVYRQADLTDKEKEMAQAIADDMSLAIQRAEAFQRLKDANTYLSQLDKMKDEFISMASHELNTPLAAIEGYLSMILEDKMGKIDAQSRTYLQRAYSSSKRLAELILDLLNVSRIEQGRLKMKFSACNLVDLATSVIHELQIRAEAKKLTLKLEADKRSIPETWCDPDRIREVIVNLVGNAIKFTEKGKITIKISQTDHRLRVEIIDTGRGIAPADRKKLFQKFSQINREKDEQTGSGLGLYISKNFVELHKGSLGLESELGKGSNFYFELPILHRAPKQLEGALLENDPKATQVEVSRKEIPRIITESSKANG